MPRFIQRLGRHCPFSYGIPCSCPVLFAVCCLRYIVTWTKIPCPFVSSQASCGDPNQTESSQRWSRSLERHRDSSVRSWTFQCDMIGVRQVASPPDQDVLGGHSRLAQPPRLHVTAEPLRLTMFGCGFSSHTIGEIHCPDPGL
jgi:hypothetical protein